MKQILIFTLAGMFVLTPCTQAALIAYEGFDYPQGSNIEGQTGGFGWADPWDFLQFYSTNVSTSLNYSDGSGKTLVTSGGKLYCVGDPAANNSSQPGRTFTNTFNVDGATTWLSFVAQRIGAKNGTAGPGGTPTFVRGANVALFDTNTTLLGQAYPGQERLDIGENSTVANDAWMFRAPATASPNPVTAVANAVTAGTIEYLALLVVRVDHITNTVDNITNDNVYLWVNPPLGVEPCLNHAATNILGRKDLTFNRLRLFAGSNNGNPQAEWFIDEIRVGDTYADVTPYTTGGSVIRPTITNFSTVLEPGSTTFDLTGGTSNTTYTVLATTNAADSRCNWTFTGVINAGAAGAGSFTNSGALTNSTLRFYHTQR